MGTPKDCIYRNYKAQKKSKAIGRVIVQRSRSELARYRGVRFLHAFRNAKCAPQNDIAPPRHSAATPASTPETVGSGLGAEAAWPAPASTSTPTAIKNCR